MSFSFFQGVPQGSVLSPILFSLYLSGIESAIKRKCEVSAFVDDIVLWKSDSDLTKLERDINIVLEDIRNFTLDYKLTFNHTKSVASFFTTNRKLYNFQPNIFLYNQPLTINKHPKYLGFVLNPEILGTKHIDNIVFKARKRLNVLRYISGHDWGADACTPRNTPPAYLKQLALERIGGIPIESVQVYTDGSTDDYYQSGSEIYIKSQDHILRIQKRNSSVFRSELIAIDEALGSLASLPNGKEIWILSDSRSAIQHLSNWQSVRDNVGVSILTELKRLSTSHQIHLQWIPSHKDLEGNEIADTLAKAGACEVPEPSAPLTFLEIFSRTKYHNKTARITPSPQSTIGISVLVLEALWLTDLQDRIKLFQSAFEVAISVHACRKNRAPDGAVCVSLVTMCLGE
ncbi:putative RNA-directed DNA polymerase from transposon BS [Trichonephila clavipes]|nr:putative RNA-directed DNA polymerase from transposon BS [Trichonephila clavipes]